jgi:hypothetical protein
VKLSLALLSILLAGRGPAILHADQVQPRQEIIDERGSLAGLRAFYVAVSRNDQLPSELRPESLRPHVELKLRQIGLKILDRPTADQPSLSVSIDILGGGGPTRQFMIHLQVLQFVRLAPTGPADRITIAATWDKNYFGAMSVTDLPRLRDHVDELLDLFLNDYLAVNPKR